MLLPYPGSAQKVLDTRKSTSGCKDVPCCPSSVQFSHSVVSDSLRPHGLWFGPCPSLISHTPCLQMMPPYPFSIPCQACPQTFPTSTTCPRPPLSVPEFPLLCGPLFGQERDGGSQLQTLTQAAAPLLSMSWTPKPQVGPEVPMPSEMRPLRPGLTLPHVDPQGCPDRNP